MTSAIASLFTDISHPDAAIPEYWKQGRLKVLFTKGGPKSADNYRPITILPVLYKLFGKVLLERVKGIFSSEQSVNQAGFRPGYSCDDHLFVVILLSEMFGEFRSPLWLVAVDFRKAFDCLDHGQLWVALHEQGVPAVLINALQRVYDGQTCRVQSDRLSKPFAIQRGVRQGDPMSPVLFNAALEKLMRELEPKWQKKRWGVKTYLPRRLVDLRFADELLLVAGSLHQARGMLADLISKAKDFGLEVHEDKTKVL